MIGNKSLFFYFIALSIILILPSCKEGETPQKKKVVIDPNKQSEFDNLVSAIDASTPSDSARSLRFENNEFQYKQLFLYLYENISCTKWILEEDKKDGKKRILKLYFNKGKLFHSSETIINEVEVLQTNSYYDDKKAGIYSSRRIAANYSEIDKTALIPCDFVKHNIKECENIKNTEFEFSTKFIELINFEGIDFIKVGQQENGGFWTDIIIPEMTDSIKNLGDSKQNIGKALQISFSVKNKNGLECQVLETISY